MDYGIEGLINDKKARKENQDNSTVLMIESTMEAGHEFSSALLSKDVID